MAFVTSEARPLRKDAARNRERILVAAAELFAEEGLGVTLDDIAKHAGVGVGTVYRRFPNRDAIVESVFEERLGRIVAAAEEGLAEPDPWTGLVLFLTRGLELQTTDRAMVTILFGTGHGRDRVADMRRRIAPLSARLIERAQASGQLRADLATTDLPILQLALSMVIDYAGTVDPEVWRRAQAVVLDGLRAREGLTPMARPPLTLDDFEQAMMHWSGPPTRGRPPG